MSELITLARPYAVAAYKYAKEAGKTQEWNDELVFLSQLMADPRLQQAATNPKVRREDFTSAFLDLCGSHLQDDAQNFVRLLIQNQRLSLLGEIADLYGQYRAEDEGYIDVDVASAFDVTAEESNKLTKTLEANLGKKVRLKVRIDPELIGGVYIRAGDRVIDASVRGQIERLAKSLLN